jgi:transposase
MAIGFVIKTSTVMNKINSNFAGQTIFVGMDIHKSSWNLGIHLNKMFIKNVYQKPEEL